ncbi:MAG: rhomboid family intramembrane serine protease [Sedimentisphaerales bacterium]|nr:rhomboid family intramembrane serine protease [Sedimentisphaerales bacterium]
MAIYQTQTGFSSPTKIFTPAVTSILVLSIIGLILSMLMPDFIIKFFALSAQGLLHGKVWQLVTYVFVNGMPINLIFSGLMILFIGSAIERQWRTASFLMLWLVISVICGLLWVLVSLILGANYIGMGAGACTYGLLATFGILNRGKRVLIFMATLEAQYLVIIFIAIGIVLNIMQPIGLIWISGALVAYLYIKLRWRMTERSASRHSQSASGQTGRFVDID